MKFIIQEKGKTVFKTEASASNCADILLASVFALPYLVLTIFAIKTATLRSSEQVILFVIAIVGGALVMGLLYSWVDGLLNTRKFELSELRQSTFSYGFGRDWSRKGYPQIINIIVDRPRYRFRLEPRNFDELRDFLAANDIKLEKTSG